MPPPQRAALTRFLDDGRLPIHNNFSERELRREAIGKNWLFIGTDDAGEVNANFVSLIASAQLHTLEPWAYLRDLSPRVAEQTRARPRTGLLEQDCRSAARQRTPRRQALPPRHPHPLTPSARQSRAYHVARRTGSVERIPREGRRSASQTWRPRLSRPRAGPRRGRRA